MLGVIYISYIYLISGDKSYPALHMELAHNIQDEACANLWIRYSSFRFSQFNFVFCD